MTGTSYTASDITRLSAVERVRKFPTRFLGEDALTTAAREIVDNAADEVAKGYGTHVTLTFHDDGSVEVADDGRGVPVDYDAGFLNDDGSRGANGIVKALGTLGAGSNYGDDAAGGGAGVHGEGGSATNAISRRFDVTVWRDGQRYRQAFKDGVAGEYAGEGFNAEAEFMPKVGDKLVPVADASGPAHGTSVRFLLDESLVPDTSLNVEELIHRAQITARLRNGMRLTVTRGGDTTTFSGPRFGAGAVMEYTTGVAPRIELAGEVSFVRQGETKHATWQLAATPAGEPAVTSTVNTVWTPDGGSYQTWALRGVGEGLASKQVRAVKLKAGESYPKGDEFAAVTSMVLAVTLTDAPARFTGQEKGGLAHEKSLSKNLSEDIARQVRLWAATPTNRDVLGVWVKQAVEYARRQRRIQAAQQAAKPSSQAGRNTNLALPDKYLPCRTTGRGSGAELHLCEGDSALATIKAARDATFQAAFPLRGKPIAAWGRTLAAMRKNAEFAGIEALLGCGVADHCDPEKCRFDRVIFTCDADVDGYNIEALLTAMFVKFFRPLLDANMVYIARPPLFIVTSGGTRVYCVNEAERDTAVQRLTAEGHKASVQRCKGLGEMNPQDFQDTVMDPAARHLYRVDYDPARDDNTLEVVFGASAKARRAWLAHHTRLGKAQLDEVFS